jgi:hypothetical protein
METRVFSPTAYTFGEERPHPQKIIMGNKRKSESDKLEGANGNNSLGNVPSNKKKTKRLTTQKSQNASANKH